MGWRLPAMLTVQDSILLSVRVCLQGSQLVDGCDEVGDFAKAILSASMCGHDRVSDTRVDQMFGSSVRRFSILRSPDRCKL